GNIEIPYYTDPNRPDRIISISAHVYNNGVWTELDQKDIYETQINEFWRAKTFSLPKLTEGSIIEYKFILESPRVHTLETWYFQESIPVKLSQLELKFENYFNFLFLINQESRLIFDKKERVVPNDLGIQSLREYNFIYKMANLPAIKPESHVTTLKNHIAKIEFQLLEFNHPKFGRNIFLEEWEDLAIRLKKDVNFGTQYNKAKNVKDILAAFQNEEKTLLKGEALIEQAYNFLLKHVSWNGKYGLLTDQPISKVFANKSGSGVEMNLMMVALLRALNVDAKPALLSTRDHGKYVKSHPIVSQFNHVICTYSIDGKEGLIDVAHIAYPYDLLPLNSLNNEALMLLDKGVEWKKITPKKSRSAYQYQLSFTDDQAQGSLNAVFNGYPQAYFKSMANTESGKEALQNLFTSNIELLDFETILEPSFKVNFELIDESLELDADYMYISPVIVDEYFDIPFKQKKRSYPVEFAAPESFQFFAKIDIPDGYVVQELPENMKLTMSSNRMVMTYIVNQEPDHVSINFKHQINELTYGEGAYQQLKDYYTKMAEKLGEQIVFKKE
ncbi:MAG: hypothetical protein AAGK97_04575, partial [Bacteroidota bacterium]